MVCDALVHAVAEREKAVADRGEPGRVEGEAIGQPADDLRRLGSDAASQGTPLVGGDEQGSALVTRVGLEADETGLDIDRVSLSKLRKESWLDDVAYRMRPFFRLYQDEMSLFHTPGGV